MRATRTSIKPRIYISAPREIRLTEAWKRRTRKAIIRMIKAHGYAPQIFLDAYEGTGLTAGQGWSPEAVERVARRCSGAVLIGVPFFRTMYEKRRIWLPTDYCQYEGAIAHACGLPILAISIGIEPRILFNEHGSIPVVSVPMHKDPSWLRSPAFQGPFAIWRNAVAKRRDVFLGYCSRDAATAGEIQRMLTGIGASVLNYAIDFQRGSSILNQIGDACAQCSCGVFLIGEDDRMKDGGFAPRDNVVFEAGYFMSAKGPDRCLIIRLGKAKMPADVEGLIYVQVDHARSVRKIRRELRDFVGRNL